MKAKFCSEEICKETIEKNSTFNCKENDLFGENVRRLLQRNAIIVKEVHYKDFWEKIDCLADRFGEINHF